MTEFIKFPSISRVTKEIIFTEKIDGTNAAVIIDDLGKFAGVQSRKRLIAPGDDNFGFAAWAHEMADQLEVLGPGHHFGEWWGQGIQRRYGMPRKVFSLFNVSRWADEDGNPIPDLPEGVDVVPTIARLETGFDEGFEDALRGAKEALSQGSLATEKYTGERFHNPEGLVVFHTAANMPFKWTFEDNEGKWKAAQAQ